MDNVAKYPILIRYGPVVSKFTQQTPRRYYINASSCAESVIQRKAKMFVNPSCFDSIFIHACNSYFKTYKNLYLIIYYTVECRYKPT